MSITIPTLRSLSIDNTSGTGPTTTTVPASTTWYIYGIESIGQGIASSTHQVYLTISGSQYILGYKHNVLIENSVQKNPRFIMDAGDSITVDPWLSIVIAYWEMETDFNTSYMDIPTLRNANYNNTAYNTWNTVATVPSNESWAIQLSSFYLTTTIGTGTGFTVSHRITKDGFVLAQDVGSVAGYIGTSKSVGFALYRYKFLLTTGDTIESRFDVAAGVPTSPSLTTQVGYWIVEQDF